MRVGRERQSERKREKKNEMREEHDLETKPSLLS